MAMHAWLEKKYIWYKKWHEKSYAEVVHYVVLLVAVMFNLLLLYKLQMIISLT